MPAPSPSSKGQPGSTHVPRNQTSPMLTARKKPTVTSTTVCPARDARLSGPSLAMGRHPHPGGGMGVPAGAEGGGG